MMENFSRCWGGAGNIIVPINDEHKIPSALWPVLERYDPDRLGYYVPTRRGQQMADAQAFESWLDASARRLADEVTSYDQSREMLLADHILDDPITSWQPPESLEEEARRRLAPFDRRRPFDEWWRADGAPPGNVLDVTHINELEGGSPISCLRANEIDPMIDLMLISRVGAVASSFNKALSERGVPVINVSARMDDLRTVLRVCWERDVAKIRREIEFMRTIGGTEEMPGPEAFLERTPFMLTEWGCAWYVVGRPWTRDLPQIVVVGDGAEDYSLALLLDRMYRQTYWCPQAFLERTDEVAVTVRRGLGQRLLEAIGYGHGSPEDEGRIRIASVSLDIDVLNSLLPNLAQDDWLAGQLSPHLVTCAVQDVNLPKPFRLYDSEHILRQRYEPFAGFEMAGTLDTPKPSGMSPVSPVDFMSPLDFTWCVDALIDSVQLPPRSCLSPLVAVFGVADDASVRASSDGISYFSREPFFIPAGASLEQMMYRPRLRLPDPTELFQSLLSASKLRGVVSQAGRFSRGALDLWGGLAPIANDLADHRRNALFEAYRKDTPSGKDPGVYLDVPRRRYLSFWDARRSCGFNREEMGSILDEYVQRGILTRGLCLKCPRCSFAAWYAVEEIDQRFRCSRCRDESWITRQAWRNPSEPLWFFALDEIVFQAIDHNARAPLLALESIRRQSRSFIFAPEMEVFDDSALLAEIDILCLVEGTIVIGEAKTVDQLGRSEAEERASLRKLLKVAEAISAHELVMATTQNSWSDRTTRILQEATKSRVRLRLVSGLGASA
jgi:hypothetical protein